MRVQVLPFWLCCAVFFGLVFSFRELSRATANMWLGYERSVSTAGQFGYLRNCVMCVKGTLARAVKQKWNWLPTLDERGMPGPVLFAVEAYSSQWLMVLTADFVFLCFLAQAWSHSVFFSVAQNFREVSHVIEVSTIDVRLESFHPLLGTNVSSKPSTDGCIMTGLFFVSPLH